MANILYKDIDLSFRAHPVTGDILTKTDDDSIKQSVKTLLLTNLYERVMHPEKGSQIRGLLFENNSPLAEMALKDTIVSVLKQYEARVAVRDINVIYDNGSYSIKLIFSIIDFQKNVEIELLLNRIR